MGLTCFILKTVIAIPFRILYPICCTVVAMSMSSALATPQKTKPNVTLLHTPTCSHISQACHGARRVCRNHPPLSRSLRSPRRTPRRRSHRSSRASSERQTAAQQHHHQTTRARTPFDDSVNSRSMPKDPERRLRKPRAGCSSCSSSLSS